VLFPDFEIPSFFGCEKNEKRQQSHSMEALCDNHSLPDGVFQRSYSPLKKMHGSLDEVSTFSSVRRRKVEKKEFDLTFSIRDDRIPRYEPLIDKHLQRHYSNPRILNRMKKKGLVAFTENKEVVCVIPKEKSIFLSRVRLALGFSLKAHCSFSCVFCLIRRL
jgi:hypothetical protein